MRIVEKRTFIGPLFCLRSIGCMIFQSTGDTISKYNEIAEINYFISKRKTGVNNADRINLAKDG